MKKPAFLQIGDLAQKQVAHENLIWSSAGQHGYRVVFHRPFNFKTGVLAEHRYIGKNGLQNRKIS
jgi:hypothetical protein